MEKKNMNKMISCAKIKLNKALSFLIQLCWLLNDSSFLAWLLTYLSFDNKHVGKS